MKPDFGADIPFVKNLGVALEHLGDGQAVLHFAPRPDHCNSFGVTHGGALATFSDIIMVMAARSVNMDHGVVTIEMKNSFLRPAPVSESGAPLVGKGKLLHRTRSMAFVEGHIYNAEGQLCVVSSGTFKYVPPRQPAAVSGVK